jgi:hypothetical protein
VHGPDPPSATSRATTLISLPSPGVLLAGADDRGDPESQEPLLDDVLRLAHAARHPVTRSCLAAVLAIPTTS